MGTYHITNPEQVKPRRLKYFTVYRYDVQFPLSEMSYALFEQSVIEKSFTSARFISESIQNILIKDRYWRQTLKVFGRI
jgi:hypothetical protein